MESPIGSFISVLGLRAVVLNLEILCPPQTPPGDIGQSLETFLFSQLGEEVLLVSVQWVGPGILPNILQYKGQPPPQPQLKKYLAPNVSSAEVISS